MNVYQATTPHAQPHFDTTRQAQGLCSLEGCALTQKPVLHPHSHRAAQSVVDGAVQRPKLHLSNQLNGGLPQLRQQGPAGRTPLRGETAGRTHESNTLTYAKHTLIHTQPDTGSYLVHCSYLYLIFPQARQIKPTDNNTNRHQTSKRLLL